MIELYDFDLSADAYKSRLLLAILDVGYISKRVDFYPGEEHRAEWFVAINPRGELPVLVDGTSVIRDPQSILIHIAKRFDDTGHWYPAHDAALVGELSVWLSFADALSATAGAARLHDSFLYEHIDVLKARADAHDLLHALDEHLWFAEASGGKWLCGLGQPTIADIACFPDVVLAGEGGIDINAYGAIRRWADRVKRIPNFAVMPGVFPE